MLEFFVLLVFAVGLFAVYAMPWVWLGYTVEEPSVNQVKKTYVLTLVALAIYLQISFVALVLLV